MLASSKAPRYDLLLDYPEGSGYVSSDPHWVVMVERLGVLTTYDRSTGVSTSTDAKKAMAPRGPTLLIGDDCVALNVERSKRSHMKTLSASLKGGECNYLREIRPGDWIMAWMVNNRTDYETLLAKIAGNERCNDPKSGLKFIGRVQSIYEDLQVSGSGHRLVTYQLQASGFSELDSQIFYDMSVGTIDVISKRVGPWITRINKEGEKFFNPTEYKENNINMIVRTLIDLIVGEGVGAEMNPAGAIRPTYGAGSTGGAKGGSSGDAYLIPTKIGALFGSAKGRTYADMLVLLQGVQEYKPEENKIASFVPKLKPNSPANRLLTTTELLGTFYPFFPDICNQPLWAVMNKFVNPAINEIYTCMRVVKSGNGEAIMPTVVFRQIPFSTDAFNPKYMKPTYREEASATQAPTMKRVDDVETKLPLTKFSNLPRWVVSPVLVTRVGVGFSDATRCNFAHVYGSASAFQNNFAFSKQITENPPIIDELDVQRSGLRSCMMTVECAVDPQYDKTPSAWMKLVADRLFGSHLTLNGSITMMGVQAPLAEGDNVELDGIVYHVESVNDSCQIGPDGSKNWRTTLQVSNGIQMFLPGDSSETWRYPGLNTEGVADATSMGGVELNYPGHTAETRYGR